MSHFGGTATQFAPKGGGGLLAPACQARSSAYAPALILIKPTCPPSSPRHAREREARRAGLAALGSPRCLARAIAGGSQAAILTEDTIRRVGSSSACSTAPSLRRPTR
jgi:hypothetical protein